MIAAILLAAAVAFIIGVLAGVHLIERKYSRLRFCESCHSDSSENHTALVDICTDCYRHYREAYYGK